MKLVNFRHLKSAVGHEHVNKNEVLNWNSYQSPTNKYKIYLLKKTWTGNNLLLTKEGDKDVIVDDDELNWQGREAKLMASAYWHNVLWPQNGTQRPETRLVS